MTWAIILALFAGFALGVLTIGLCAAAGRADEIMLEELARREAQPEKQWPRVSQRYKGKGDPGGK